ncbi:MAG TPA: hypothetical protein VGJ84_07315 [Polyangiaceae bacterium]
MKEVQLCPEDLLDRARAGQLGSEQRQLLEAHLEVCRACQLERELASELLSDAEPQARDLGLVERMAERFADPSRHVTRGVRRSPRRFRPLVAGAAVLAIGGAAAAAWIASHPTRSRGVPSAPHTDPPQSQPLPLGERSSARMSAPSQVEPPTPIVELPRAAAGTNKTPETGAPPSAADLFASANAARRHANAAQAAALFRELQSRYPMSPEQQVSRVALGRLFLQQLGNPAGALEQFDAYLAQGGPLREEAMVGRARALGRLSRLAEERRAWELLLENFPDSLHADEAHSRIAPEPSTADQAPR